MNGYKVQHGLPLDTKLAVVAKRAELRRGEVLAVWISLLDHASQGTPRGCVKDLDPEQIAIALDFEPTLVEAALQGFREKKFISAEGALAGWEKSQTLSSTLRTRAFRARQRQKNRTAQDDDSEEEVLLRRERLRNKALQDRNKHP